MIEFDCPQCHKRFSVADALAGRRAKCKACGASIQIPPASPPSNVMAPPARPPVRVRRLMADAQQLRGALNGSDTIEILEALGDPPERYRLRYRIASLAPGDGKSGDPVPAREHEVEVALTSDYPRLAPVCRMLSPIFHPNIDTSTICVGDHWTAGERLVDLVVRIGEMLAFQAYNIRSPLNAQAAMWVDLNPDRLPTDPRDLRPANLG